jgi:hypothetical protein
VRRSEKVRPELKIEGPHVRQFLAIGSHFRSTALEDFAADFLDIALNVRRRDIDELFRPSGKG